MSEEANRKALERLGSRFDQEFWLLENGRDRLYTRQEVITMLSHILGNVFFEFANKTPQSPSISKPEEEKQ